MTTRVLIIERDSDFRASVAIHLRQAGFAIVAAADGSEALATLKRQAVDVVLLGLAGPGAGGRSLLRQVRTGWPGIRVITLNQEEQIELSIEAMKLGAFADIMPPFDLDALCDSVRAAGAAVVALQPSGGGV